MTYYQIVVRKDPDRWQPFEVPTASYTELMYLLGLAQRYHSNEDITVLHSASLSELGTLIEAYRTGHVVGDGGMMMSAMCASPAGLVTDEALDHRRWEVERGQGGDHDAPYTFSLPPNLHTRTVWIHLLARASRGELVP